MNKDYDPDSPEAKACISQPGGIHTLCPSPTNPRKTFDDASMAELTENVRHHGVLQPILTRLWPVAQPYPAGDMPLYEIVAGERRYRAAKAAGQTLIPMLVRDLTDKEVLEIQVIENLQRKDLHPLEEADGYHLMMEKHGYRAEDLAEKIGKSRSYIFGRLKLLDLDPESRRLFQFGKLNASTALLVARIPSEKLRAKAINEITGGVYGGGEMSVRKASEHIQHNYMLKLAEAPFPRGDSDLVALAGRCFDCVKRTGNNPDIFEDVKSADVCTDPECYKEKSAAHSKREAEKAIAAGATVITGDAARKIAPYGIDSSTLKNYTRLDEKCHEDPDKRTYREILGDSDTVLIEDPSKAGRLVSAMPNNALAEKLVAAGIRSRDAERAKEAAITAKKIALERLYRGEMYRQIRDKINALTGGENNHHLIPSINPFVEAELLRNFAGYMWERTYDEVRKKLATSWDTVGANASERSSAFAKRIPNMTPGEVWRLMIDMYTIAESSVEGEWSLNYPPKKLLATAEILSIDTKEIQRLAEAEQKENEQAKSAKSGKKGKKTAQKSPGAASAEASYPLTAAQAANDSARNPAAPAQEGNVQENRKAEEQSSAADAAVEKGPVNDQLFDVGDLVRITDNKDGLFGEIGEVIACGKYPSGRVFYGVRIGDDELDFFDFEVEKAQAWHIRAAGEKKAPSPAGAVIDTNEKPSPTKPAFAIGAAVRVKDDAKGPTGKARKCCGREGKIQGITEGSVTCYNVKFGERGHEFVANLTADELDLVEQQSSAAEAAQVEKPVVFYPSSRDERETFYDVYCRRCAKDKAMRDGLSDRDTPDDAECCDLIGASTMYRPDAEGYPKEWHYRGGIAVCSDFTEFSKDSPATSDAATGDLFKGEK